MPLHNVSVMWILISAVILLCVCRLGIAQSLTYLVFTLEHTPLLDGKVDSDSAWQNIPEASGLRLLASGQRHHRSSRLGLRSTVCGDVVCRAWFSTLRAITRHNQFERCQIVIRRQEPLTRSEEATSPTCLGRRSPGVGLACDSPARAA